MPLCSNGDYYSCASELFVFTFISPVLPINVSIHLTIKIKLYQSHIKASQFVSLGRQKKDSKKDKCFWVFWSHGEAKYFTAKCKSSKKHHPLAAFSMYLERASVSQYTRTCYHQGYSFTKFCGRIVAQKGYGMKSKIWMGLATSIAVVENLK